MKLLQKNSGSTLLELIVSATIMLVVLFAVLSVIRVGSQLEVDDNHRRVARSLVTSWFENNFTAGAFDTITVPRQITYTDTVDGRDGAPIIGQFSADIVESTVTVSSLQIPIITATAKISWQEYGGIEDSIVLTKWIANIQ